MAFDPASALMALKSRACEGRADMSAHERRRSAERPTIRWSADRPASREQTDPRQPAGRRFGNFVFAIFPLGANAGARALGANGAGRAQGSATSRSSSLSIELAREGRADLSATRDQTRPARLSGIRFGATLELGPLERSIMRPLRRRAQRGTGSSPNRPHRKISAIGLRARSRSSSLSIDSRARAAPT